MSFREKLKRAFKSSSPLSSKHASPVIAPQQEQARWPSNVYRPDEPLPRLKYRAPVKKEHKEKLESYMFGSANRRKSQASLHSPMGSRMPSRRSSRVGRKSMSGPANREAAETRRKSIVQAAQMQLKAQEEALSEPEPPNMEVEPEQVTVQPPLAPSPAPEPALRSRQSLRVAHAPPQVDEQAKLENELATTGAMTSTVAFIVPAKSAKLVYHATSTRKPRPVSILIHGPNTRSPTSKGMLNPNTVAAPMGFKVEPTPPARFITLPALDASLPMSPTSMTNQRLSAMTLSPTTTSPSATRTTFYAANTARNRRSLLGPTPPPLGKRTSSARSNRTSTLGLEAKHVAASRPITVKVQPVSACLSDDDADADLGPTDTRARTTAAAGASPAKVVDLFSPLCQSPPPKAALPRIPTNASSAVAAAPARAREMSPITGEVQANIAHLQKCRRLPRGGRVSVRPISTGVWV